jgi:hypothetical protein
MSGMEVAAAEVAVTAGVVDKVETAALDCENGWV